LLITTEAMVAEHVERSGQSSRGMSGNEGDAGY
jgi:hypothetical protein